MEEWGLIPLQKMQSVFYSSSWLGYIDQEGTSANKCIIRVLMQAAAILIKALIDFIISMITSR